MNRGWVWGLLFLFRGDRSRAQKLENRWNCLNSFVWGYRSQRKTSQAALANELQKNAPAAGEIIQPSARVIDGMVLVLRLKNDHKKFSYIGECLCTRDLMFSLACIDRIQFSKRNAEREHWGTEYGNKFTNLQPNHKVQQWRKFPLNPQKKKALIIFILPKNKNKTRGTSSFL